jgi:hypothetical protein
MSSKSALFFLILFLACFAAFADRIYLKNGNRIDGRVLEENQGEITVEVDGGTVKLGQWEVERIVKEDWSPELKPVSAQAVPTPAAVKAAQTPAWNSMQETFFQGFQQAISGNLRRNFADTLPFKASPWILVPLGITTYLLLLVIQALWEGLLIKLFMKFFDEGVNYLTAVMFQFRLSVVSTFALLIGIGLPLALAYFFHMSPGGAAVFTLLGGAAAGLIMIVLFFVYAGRYLGLGFIKSLGLIIWTAFIQFAIQFGAGFAVGISR